MISNNDPSLHELVLEFDDKPVKKKVDASIKCMYFVTQGDIDTRIQSDRWCVDADSKVLGDEKGFPKSERIPLWNVKRIDTNVVEEGIVDMTFVMRYTNFTSTVGYYTAEEKDIASNANKKIISDAISAGQLPEESRETYDLKTVIFNKHPEVLKWDSDKGEWEWQTPSWIDFVNGAFL